MPKNRNISVGWSRLWWKTTFMDLVVIPAVILVLSTLSISLFPCNWAVMGRLHHRVSHSVKNYRISHLVNIYWPGGLFVCDALDLLGKTSFRFFVKWQMARIDWPKRVFGYFEKAQNLTCFPVVEGMCFWQAPPQETIPKTYKWLKMAILWTGVGSGLFARGVTSHKHVIDSGKRKE